MARATAAQSASDPTVEPGPPVAPEPETPGDTWGFWRYNGPPGLIYTPVPVTVDPGDIIQWPTAPAADGWWSPSEGPANKRPDNQPEGV